MCQLIQEEVRTGVEEAHCSRIVGVGRYRWHHDQVLWVIAEVISTGMSSTKKPTWQSVAFSAGEKSQQHQSQAGGAAGNSLGLAAEGRPWEAAQIPRERGGDHTQARHSPVLCLSSGS